MIRRLAIILYLLLGMAVVPALAQDAFSSNRISVSVEGRGKDVILIPGLSSQPRVWKSTAAAVPGHRYHFVHVAGFAGKTADGNAEGVVAAPVADEIARYIKEAGLRKPAVIGHSMGGSIGMMLAARHPEAVGKLMIVDMLPFMGAMFGPPGATPEQVRPVADAMRDGMKNSPVEARRAQIEKTIAGMINTAAERPAVVEDSMVSDIDVSARAMHELIVTDLRPELANIAAPTTVLYVVPTGAPFTPEQIDAFYKASYANLKGATLTRIPDAAHFIMYDSPARFQAEVKAFLQ